LKLILSVDSLSPRLSGIGRYTYEIASRVTQPEYKIDMVRFYNSGNWIKDPNSLLIESAATSQKSKKKKFKYPRWVKKIYLKQVFKNSIFHAPNFFLPSQVENGIITVHDLSVFKFPETHPIERVRQFETLFNLTLQNTGHIITDTETTRQEVINYFSWPENKISAVHLGVSKAFFPHELSQLSSLSNYKLTANSYTLCVATIEPRKRIAELINAYKLLPQNLRLQFPLVLVGGTGWRSESIHNSIKDAQQAGWLHYFGFVPESDLPTIYAGARLFVYPSTYEGFGLPPIEAMASAIPVIVSNQSCLPEVTKGAALTIDPNDLAAFSENLKKGLLDEDWRETAIKNGLNVASQYRWEDCVKNIVNVYKKHSSLK
jgi:glycosyltransferase involved in cell wall biosynthesis